MGKVLEDKVLQDNVLQDKVLQDKVLQELTAVNFGDAGSRFSPHLACVRRTGGTGGAPRHWREEPDDVWQCARLGERRDGASIAHVGLIAPPHKPVGIVSRQDEQVRDRAPPSAHNLDFHVLDWFVAGTDGNAKKLTAVNCASAWGLK